MKKVLVLFVAIFTVCMMLTGCGKQSLEGYWVLESAMADGVKVEKEGLKTLGMDSNFYIHLDKDSKCDASMMGMTAEGTWKEVKDGVEVTIEGSTMKFTKKGKTLVATQEMGAQKVEMVFTYSKDKPNN